MLELRDKIIAEIAGEFGGEHQFARKAASVADAILKMFEEWVDQDSEQREIGRAEMRDMDP